MQKVTIYSITRIGTEDSYVGSSIALRSRWKTHRYELNKGIHHCFDLQKQWAEHGPEAFIFEVLAQHECKDVNERAALELQWIIAKGNLNAMREYVDTHNFTQSDACRALQSATNRAKAANDPDYAAFLDRRGKELTAYMQSVEGRANMGRHTKRRWKDPEERKRLRAGLDRKDHEVEARRSANIGKAHSTPEMKAMHRANAAKMLENPVLVAKMLKGSKDYWANPENRAKRAEMSRQMHARRRAAKAALEAKTELPSPS